MLSIRRYIDRKIAYYLRLFSDDSSILRANCESVYRLAMRVDDLAYYVKSSIRTFPVEVIPSSLQNPELYSNSSSVRGSIDKVIDGYVHPIKLQMIMKRLSSVCNSLTDALNEIKERAQSLFERKARQEAESIANNVELKRKSRDVAEEIIELHNMKQTYTSPSIIRQIDAKLKVLTKQAIALEAQLKSKKIPTAYAYDDFVKQKFIEMFSPVGARINELRARVNTLYISLVLFNRELQAQPDADKSIILIKR